MELGFSEMLFIVFLALLLFGPRKLPEIGRQIGKALAEFRRAKNEFTAQIEDEVRRLDQEEAANKLAPVLLAEENRILPAETTPRGVLAPENDVVLGNGAPTILDSADLSSERSSSTTSDPTNSEAPGRHA